MRPVYGTTIFCDDIRREVGGKLTFVGVYTNGLRLHAPYPAMLPKFCMHITVNVDAEDTHEIEGMELRVYLPGDPIETPSFSASIPEVPPPPPRPDHDPGHYPGRPVTRLTSEVNMAALVLRQDGPIQVRAFFKSGEIGYLGSLRITNASEASAAPTASPPPSEQSPPASPAS